MLQISLWQFYAVDQAAKYMEIFTKSRDPFIKGCAHYIVGRYTLEATGKTMEQIFQEMEGRNDRR